MILNQIIAHFIMRFVIAYIERNEKEGKEIVGAHTKVNTIDSIPFTLIRQNDSLNFFSKTIVGKYVNETIFSLSLSFCLSLSLFVVVVVFQR